MKRLFISSVAIAVCVFSFSTTLQAKVVDSGSDFYILKHTAKSSLTPEQLWQKLVKPNTWWHPDHTYSGDANNLSLDLSVGGAWAENWQGNGVEHGRVVYFQKNKTLRLDAPFGPLQSMGVSVVWTISIEATDSGSQVTFDEVANGSQASQLNQIAGAVDGVKQQAIMRLTR